MDFRFAVVPVLIALAGILVAWLAVRRMMSLRTKGLGMVRKTSERIVLSRVALITVLLAASSAINVVAFARFRHAPPGAIYEVNGHAMRIDCTGSGSPTIVLDAGLGGDGLVWGGVQPVRAKTTRVCSYDRAGYGWSDAAPPPRDADHIAMDLHGLLAAAGIDGPVVLMGHSMAGIYIRDYATRYPANVAGLVFVDGSTPLQEKDPAFEAHAHMTRPGFLRVLLVKAAFSAGIPRWFGQCSHPPDWPDRRAAYLMVEDRCYMGIDESLGESGNMEQSGDQTVHTGPYGAMPILVFSSDEAKQRAEKMPGDVLDAWNRMQQNLLKLSTRSRRIIAKGSGHTVQLERPELIEKEVSVFIEQIRGTAPAPTNYGSTMTE
jgi:pimeloyl-ACP methyl ester carboxylesterase